MIIDTKWKRLAASIDDAKQGVSQSDVYQMMAYGRLYECPRLMLLYPHHDELGQSEGKLSQHRINGSFDILATATIGLSDLRQSAPRLTNLVVPALAQQEVGTA